MLKGWQAVPIALLRGMIWIYRHSISLFVGRQCRFLPTCSAYADEALQKYGLAKGGSLALRRLCKCHPFSKESGFDPVP